MKSHSKTYLLFTGCDDWIEGGAWDLEGVYGSQAEARTAFRESEDDWDWAHILIVVDGENTRIVSTYKDGMGWRAT